MNLNSPLVPEIIEYFTQKFCKNDNIKKKIVLAERFHFLDTYQSDELKSYVFVVDLNFNKQFVKEIQYSTYNKYNYDKLPKLFGGLFLEMSSTEVCQ